MQELSLHILDIVENSLAAGAKLVTIEISEEPRKDRLSVTIRDDGRGMDPESAARATDPFVTSRTSRRVGLGLSLWQAHARAWGGDLNLESAPGRGTTVRAWFRLGHIDRQPLGDWPRTLAGLIATRPGVEFVYRHRVDGDEFELDTRQLKAELDVDSLASPQIASFLVDQIGQALDALGSTA
ncbi:MAG: ATP-binding protein [Thermodesulfobacteriota bacterium]